jgi:hypothetical protein
MAFINHREQRPTRDVHARHRTTSLNTAIAAAMIAAAPEPVKAIDIRNRDIVTFKGNHYDLEALLRQPGTKIDPFNKDELHDNFMTLAVPSREFSDTVKDHAPILAKYEGKYVVLVGLKKVLEQFHANEPIVGKLLPNPVLKHAIAR